MTILQHTFTDSAMLSNCVYNPENEELVVQFKNGKSYTYIDVPRRTFDELIEAKSAGRYFNLIKAGLVQKS